MGALGIALAMPFSMAHGHGIIDEEIARLTQQLQDRPGDPQLLRQRAERHRAHGDLPAARADLLAASAVVGVAADILLQLARIERETGRLEEAQQVIGRFLENHSENPVGLREKALIHSAAEQWPAAAETWQAVLRHQTKPDVEPFLACAHALCLAESPDAIRSALEVLRRGMVEHPRSIPLHQRAAAVCIKLGMVDEAQGLLTSIQKAYPALHPRLLAAEGALWAEHGDTARSLEAYRRARAAFGSLPQRQRGLPGFKSLGDSIDLAIADHPSL